MQKLKKGLALLLALCLCLSLMSVGVFADAEDEDAALISEETEDADAEVIEESETAPDAEEEEAEKSEESGAVEETVEETEAPEETIEDAEEAAEETEDEQPAEETEETEGADAEEETEAEETDIEAEAEEAARLAAEAEAKAAAEEAARLEAERLAALAELRWPADDIAISRGTVDYTVTAEIPAGAFPEWVELRVDAVVWGDLTPEQQAALEAEGIGEAEAAQLLDIRFENADGEEVEPDDTIGITIASTVIAEAENVEVYHVDESGAEAEAVLVATTDEELAAEDEGVEQIAVKDGAAVAEFEVDGFSLYVIAKLTDEGKFIVYESDEFGNEGTKIGTYDTLAAAINASWTRTNENNETETGTVVDNGGTIKLPKSTEENPVEVTLAGEFAKTVTIDGNGGTVKLSGDVSMTLGWLKFKGNTTLDLNGCTITSSEAATVIAAFADPLTITDSSSEGTGKITNTCAATGNATVLVQNGSKLYVKGGTIESSTAQAVKSVIRTVADNTECYIEISGGTITGREYPAVLSSSSPIVITGGKITTTGTDTYARAVQSQVSLTISGGEIDAANGMYAVLSTGVAEISGGKLTGGGTCTVYNGGAGTLTVKGSAEISNSGNTITNWGTLNVEDSAKISCTNNNTVVNRGTGKLYVKGGEISTTSIYAPLYNYAGGQVSISGGKVSHAGNSDDKNNTAFGNQGTATISGGTFEAKYYTVNNSGAGTLTISGGTFTGTQQAVYNSSTGNVNIDGGTFNGPYTVVNNANGNTVITGGTFTSTYSNLYIPANTTGTGTIKVSGGTFGTAVPEGFCATGYAPKELEDGKYTVGATRFTVTASVTNAEIQASDTVTVTVKATSEVNATITAYDIALSLPEGLTLKTEGGEARLYNANANTSLTADTEVTLGTIDLLVDNDAAKYNTPMAIGIASATVNDAEAATASTASVKVTSTYTITWKSDENTTLGTTTVNYNETPTHSKPLKTAYAFDSWEPEIVPATADATYTAKWTPKTYYFTVKIDDGDAADYSNVGLTYSAEDKLGTYTVESGIPGTPYWEGHRFYGWTVVNAANSNWELNKTYSTEETVGLYGGYQPGVENGSALPIRAVWDYSVTFINWDGTLLAKQTVGYNETPVYPGATAPTKESDNANNYYFAGWSSNGQEIDLGPATRDITYRAVFTNEEKTFTVKWKYGNVEKSVTGLKYGETPTEPANLGTPTKDADAQFTYTFSGWGYTGSVPAVTGDTTYTAQFTTTTNKYKVTWIVEGESTEEEYFYDQMPTHDEPTKAATAQHSYKFTGWEPEVEQVTKNATYTAKFEEMTNEYTVTWDIDGATSTETYTYGATPNYSGTPTRPGSGYISYVFTGWSPAIAEVTGNATYTAQFRTIDSTPYDDYDEPASNTNNANATTDLVEIVDDATPLAALPESFNALTVIVDGVPTLLAEIPLVYSDVALENWARDAIAYVTVKGIMNGTGDGDFSPTATATGDMLAAMVYRLNGGETSEGANWAETGLAWLEESNLTEGIAYDPNEAATREQLVTILYRMAESEGYDVSARADLGEFTDAEGLSEFASDAMAWAVSIGLIKGMGDGTLNSAGAVTREQIATIFMRYALLLGK